MKKGTDFQTRSEAVQEIIGHAPNWLLRWGSALIFFIVLLFLLLSFIIQYPDTVTSRIIIMTNSSSFRVIARSGGEVGKILVQQKQRVMDGEYLVVFRNTANFDDMMRLHLIVNGVSSDTTRGDRIIHFPLDENLTLGEVQKSYNHFRTCLSDFRFFNLDASDVEIVSRNKVQLREYEELRGNKRKQKIFLEEEVSHVQKRLDQYKKSFDGQTDSVVMMHIMENKRLETIIALQNTDNELTSIDVQIIGLKRSMENCQLQYDRKKRTLTFNLENAIRNLENDVSAWEQKYVLKAPVKGFIFFTKCWSQGQTVNPGEEVLSVVQEKKPVFGRILMPLSSAGKIKSGQRVHIKLDNYPFNEFGIVSGRIDSVSSVAKENFYLITVRLPEGLKTSYQKNLKFVGEMSGTAEVITAELRFGDRIFGRFRSLYHSILQ